MDLGDLIRSDAILPALRASSKKQVLQELSAAAATATGLPERDVFETVVQRERLGSTGVGNGIAIPHGKLAALSRMTGVFARLTRPVDFEAFDDQPVDLVFLLMAPEGAGAEHLKALAKIARLMREPQTVSALRASTDAGTIHALMTAPPFAA